MKFVRVKTYDVRTKNEGYCTESTEIKHYFTVTINPNMIWRIRESYRGYHDIFIGDKEFMIKTEDLKNVLNIEIDGE